MRRLLVVLVGCTQPLPRPPSQQAAPVAPPSLPPWRLACSGAVRSEPKRIVYDFMPVPLLPVPRGPRVEQRSHAGYARTVLQLHELLQREKAAIIGCWKWASARGAPATSLDLAVTIGFDGTSRGLELSRAGAGTRELERCLRDTLEGVALPERSPRTTRFRATLEFARVDQPPWPHDPARPMPRTRVAPARSCGPVLDGAAPDAVTEARPFLVEDRDPSREPNRPHVSVGCVSTSTTLSKTRIRTAFASNRGAFQTCYASARARAKLGPEEPGGTIAIHARFGTGGIPHAVTTSGNGDAAFHRCMEAAARDVWLTPAPGERVVEVNFPFDLRPPGAPPVTAEDMLAADDIDGALAVWTGEARQSTGAAACRAKANIARAHVARAPWLDDARLYAALAEVGRAADALPRTEAVACIEPIAGFARELAFGEAHAGRGHRWDLVSRVAATLPFARVVPWGDDLRWIHAEALVNSARRSDGIAALQAMRRDPALGHRADKLLAELQARTIPLREGCF